MKILFNNNSIQFLVAVFYGRDAEQQKTRGEQQLLDSKIGIRKMHSVDNFNFVSHYCGRAHRACTRALQIKSETIVVARNSCGRRMNGDAGVMNALRYFICCHIQMQLQRLMRQTADQFP